MSKYNKKRTAKKRCIWCDKQYDSNSDKAHGQCCSVECYSEYYDSGAPAIRRIMG
jgi:hypothetical protein